MRAESRRHAACAALILFTIGCASGRATPATSTRSRCDAESSAKSPSERGLRICEAAVREHPDSAELRAALAVELANQRRLDEALESWKEVTRLKPSDFSGHHNTGLMLEIGGRFAESLAAFERALPLAPDVRSEQTTAWHIGVAHYNSARIDQSIAWFREAGALDSTDASAWSYAGIGAARLGNHAEAVSYWARALVADRQYFDKAQPGERRMFETSLRQVGPQLPALVTRMGLVPVRQ